MSQWVNSTCSLQSQTHGVYTILHRHYNEQLRGRSKLGLAEVCPLLMGQLKSAPNTMALAGTQAGFCWEVWGMALFDTNGTDHDSAGWGIFRQ